MIYFENDGERIAPKDLSSTVFTDYSKQISAKGSFKIWFCNKKSLQKVRGGEYGKQTIKTRRFKNSVLKKVRKELSTVDKLTGIKLVETSKRKGSDIRIYLDDNVDLGFEKYLGITTFNLANKSKDASWEVFLNHSTIKSSNKMIYTMLHELGHTFGLEHPHDDSDYDYHKSTVISKSALPRHTIMSYAKPSWGIYPNRYSSNDIRALQYIWGKQNDQLLVVGSPIRPSIDAAQTINIARKREEDFIVDGYSAPNSIVKVIMSGRKFDTINANHKGKWELVLDAKFIRRQKDQYGTLLQFQQHDEFGYITESSPYFLNFID